MSDKSRRKLLKSIAAGSGAIVAGKSLPESWSRPVVDSVMLPAHAQTSQPISQPIVSCFGAPTIACGSSVSGSTIGGTVYAPGFCGTVLDTAGGVWYHFIGTGGDVEFSTCNNADYDTKIGIFSGNDCGNLICVDGVDDSPGCAGFTSRIITPSENGVNYHIYITGYATAEGNFTLDVNCV